MIAPEAKNWANALEALKRRDVNTSVCAADVIVLEECASTMQSVKDYFKDKEFSHQSVIYSNLSPQREFVWCYALLQTQGRGRQGKVWISDTNQGMYLSILNTKSISYQSILGISLVIGVSLARVLESFSIVPQLKWPNDVLVNFKKVSGILVETFPAEDDSTRCHLNIGIGLNINQDIMPPDIKGTSLRLELGRSLNYEEVCLEVAASVCEDLLKFSNLGLNQFLEEWTSYSIMNGALVSRVGEGVLGRVQGLASDGGLILNNGEDNFTLISYDNNLLYEFDK